jgi:hypothetical protein
MSLALLNIMTFCFVMISSINEDIHSYSHMRASVFADDEVLTAASRKTWARPNGSVRHYH